MQLNIVIFSIYLIFLIKSANILAKIWYMHGVSAGELILKIIHRLCITSEVVSVPMGWVCPRKSGRSAGNHLILFLELLFSVFLLYLLLWRGLAVLLVAGIFQKLTLRAWSWVQCLLQFWCGWFRPILITMNWHWQFKILVVTCTQSFRCKILWFDRLLLCTGIILLIAIIIAVNIIISFLLFIFRHIRILRCLVVLQVIWIGKIFCSSGIVFIIILRTVCILIVEFRPLNHPYLSFSS